MPARVVLPSEVVGYPDTLDFGCYDSALGILRDAALTDGCHCRLAHVSLR